MARLRLELDPDTYGKLVERAVEERRPVVWQAEVILRDALSVSAQPSALRALGGAAERGQREHVEPEAVSR